MVDGLYVQIFGNILFTFVFLFLWRQSGVVYFKYWTLAWAAETIALLFTMLARSTHSPRWLLLHALFEFGFALSLVAAARAATSRTPGTLGKWLRALVLFPVFLLVGELFGWNQQYAAFQAIHSLPLAVIFLVSFFAFTVDGGRAQSISSDLFRYTLLGLGLLFLFHSCAFFYYPRMSSPNWAPGHLEYLHFYALGLQTMLAFSTLAMWIEYQEDRVAEIGEELDHVRRETSRKDLDHLTGLLNHATLSRRLELPFAGVVAVCDIDNFKSVNDRYGHLVGDEILRHFGNLLRSSVRAEDEAFRWGGDEFVILFHQQTLPVGSKRMSEISERFVDFRARGLSTLQIHFSWGVAEGGDQPLRQAIERADNEMYTRKREQGKSRSAGS